jgi:hypothetical protein
LKLRKIQEVSEKLIPSLYLAFQRITGVNKTIEKDLNTYLTLVCNDIFESFPEATVDQIKGAIKAGSFGKYGKVTRFTGIEVYMWIEQYLPENPRIPGEEEKEYLKLWGQNEGVGYLLELGYDRKFGEKALEIALNDSVAMQLAKPVKQDWRSYQQMMDFLDDIIETGEDDQKEYAKKLIEQSENMKARFLHLHSIYGDTEKYKIVEEEKE